jgi:DNA mismatch repair protein MSH6
VLRPIANNSRSRASKRRKVIEEDSDDEFGLDAATQQAMLEDGTPTIHVISITLGQIC